MKVFQKPLSALLLSIPLAVAVFPAQASIQQAPQPSSELSYTFDFENVLRPFSTTDAALSGFGLGNIGLSSNISLAMTSSLQSVAKTATVTVSGAVATQDYNGEGRSAKTLGNSDGDVLKLKMDTFLTNNNFGAVQKNASAAKNGPVVDADRFKLSFENFTVTGVQFDYQIFPDAQCQKNSGCGPDMSLLAGANKVWSMTTTPSSTIDPQALGVTPNITFDGVNSLTFVDWPSEIGIDNLTVTGCVTEVAGKCASTTTPVTPAVPEPATIALFGLGLFGLVGARRRNRYD